MVLPLVIVSHEGVEEVVLSNDLNRGKVNYSSLERRLRGGQAHTRWKWTSSWPSPRPVTLHIRATKRFISVHYLWRLIVPRAIASHARIHLASVNYDLDNVRNVHSLSRSLSLGTRPTCSLFLLITRTFSLPKLLSFFLVAPPSEIVSFELATRPPPPRLRSDNPLARCLFFPSPLRLFIYSFVRNRTAVRASKDVISLLFEFHAMPLSHQNFA